MINQVYRLTENEGSIEFWVAETNELNPTRDTREMAISVIPKNGDEVHSDLNPDKLDSLIEYLVSCREYVNEYNEESKPQK